LLDHKLGNGKISLKSMVLLKQKGSLLQFVDKEGNRVASRFCNNFARRRVQHTRSKEVVLERSLPVLSTGFEHIRPLIRLKLFKQLLKLRLLKLNQN
jgi:hypothetical protein